MKKIILGLEDNRQVFIFAILGLIMIIFPEQVGTAVPYILGIGLLVYGCLNIIISLKYPDSSVSLGGGVINIVLGILFLIQKSDSIAILGVVWAMISLYEAAKEIDDYRHKKKLNLITIISVIVSIALAVILMINPFAHFNTHVRILGLEIIATTLARGRIELKKKRDNTDETAA